jgi:hypothetical protein
LSQSRVYNLDVSGSLTVKNIFIPPTLGFLRTNVTKGDFLALNGYALPDSQIDIEIDGEIIKEKTQAAQDGFYKLLYNTAGLSFGQHTIRVREMAPDGEISDFSLQKTFSVSQLFVPMTDLNSDGIINISDWSIFLSIWGSKDKEQGKRIDFNGDGKINISDFSIFVRTIRK